MTRLPPDLAEWLPGDVLPGAVSDWAVVSRSFDRKHGETLVLRDVSGALSVLTRPERFELFRALPLAAGSSVRITQRGEEPQLEASTVDGRALAMPLLHGERDELQRVLERPSGSRRAPRTSAPPSVPPAPSPLPASSPPQRTRLDRGSTMRAPVSAEMEVVRVPKTVRPPVDLPEGEEAQKPSSAPPAARARAAPRGGPAPGKRPPPAIPPTRDGDDESSDASGSVQPPAFAAEPAPIVRTARDLPALRASFRHHWEQGALDEASQVARALAHLGVADAMEQRLARLQPESPPGFPTPLSPYLFRAFLAHDEENADVGRLLAALWPAYLQMRARSDRELGLRPRDELELAHVTTGVGHLFAHGARAFSLDRPRFFLRTDVPGGMAHLHAWPIASLCGGTLATGFDEASMLHVLGHHLSLYRHEAYLVALAPSQLELEGVVFAALHLEGRLPSSDPRVTGLADTLARHMVPAVRDGLRAAIADLRIGASDPRGELVAALRLHRRAVHHTAVRAGFALSGSLGISDRMQRMMPAVPGVTTDELIDDVVTYSVSPSWIALRKELGISMEPSGANPPVGRGA